MIKQILITGGNGLVGRALCQKLSEEGYSIAILSRNRKINGVKMFIWDYENDFIEDGAIEFADCIIHLAGESIASKRWTSKQKAKIRDSRIKSAEFLFERIKNAKKKPFRFISASAIGFYGGQTLNHIFTEADTVGNDFLSETTNDLEESIKKFNSIGISYIICRLGIVLSKHGGALPKMIMPIHYGFGSGLGKGLQYMPWISLYDLVRLFHFVLEKSEANEIYNAVTPNFISNNEFNKQLARILNKPFFMPNIPAILIKIALGEMSIIVGSSGSQCPPHIETSEKFHLYASEFSGSLFGLI